MLHAPSIDGVTLPSLTYGSLIPYSLSLSTPLLKTVHPSLRAVNLPQSINKKRDLFVLLWVHFHNSRVESESIMR